MARLFRSTPTAEVTEGKFQATPENERKGKLSTAEARREYQRRYYQMHKEKAKEYQRQYNLTHKKKLRAGRGGKGMSSGRDAVRSTFNTADIMHSPVEKTVRILEKIIKGERFFTM
jgi:hypothetical protein